MRKTEHPVSSASPLEEIARRSALGPIMHEADTLRAELVRELAPSSALERAVVADYADVMCQNLSLRRLREKLEWTYALAAIWSELANAMLEAESATGGDVPAVEQQAKLIVERLARGEWEAREEIERYGVNIEEASARGIAENLQSLAEIEKNRERLSNRARQLLQDVERNATFMAKRKSFAIPDAEIVP